MDMQSFSSRPFSHVSRARIHNPVVQAPKPVQTCSLKAEYGGSDVILFRSEYFREFLGVQICAKQLLPSMISPHMVAGIGRLPEDLVVA